jgi:23S rRNA pseudouridine1911/1915/1917 synthase
LFSDELMMDEVITNPLNSGHFHYDGPEILFEDNHLIAVNKRASDIVQTDQTLDTPMTAAISDYLRYTYGKPGNVFLGVIHRLDRPVSGIVIFAKTSKALMRMNDMFKYREITKKYWALVKDPPAEISGHLINYIRKNERQNKSYVFPDPIKGSLKAELKYNLLGKSDTYYLLEVELLTGRHHQIRAQLSAIGCPIKGDVKYGFPRPNPDLSIGLHARYLSFIHPVKQEQLTIIADPPADPVWDYFKNQFGIETHSE